MRSARWILLGALAAALAGCAEPLLAPPEARTLLQRAECHGLRPEKWLAGRWGTVYTHVRFRAEDGRFTWTYVRDPGVVSERWGLKEPAGAEGVVRRIDGCEIELEGRYTDFGGTRRALGSPMTYRLKYDGGRLLVGTGLGWGREAFEVFWTRSE